MEQIDWWPWSLVCSIGYLSFTMIYLNADLVLTLVFFYGKLKYGKKQEHKISWNVFA